MKTLVLGVAMGLGVLALPAAAFAATYAYVNTSGEVMTMEAASAATALSTAPNLATHSGVMLVSSDDADLVGNDVNL